MKYCNKIVNACKIVSLSNGKNYRYAISCKLGLKNSFTRFSPTVLKHYYSY